MKHSAVQRGAGVVKHSPVCAGQRSGVKCQAWARLRYSFGVRALIGSYSIPSLWTGTPLGHGAGIVGVTGTATASAGPSTGATPSMGSGTEFTLAATHVWAENETNPSFLALAADGAVWAITEPERGGELLRFAPGREGWPSTTAPARIATGADAPCHLALGTGTGGPGSSAAPAVVFVSHYHGGVVTAIVCGAAGDPERVAETITLPDHGIGWDRSGSRSRPHSVLVLPGGEHFLVADCGRDLVALYAWDQSAETADLLDVLVLASGTGPRHLTRRAASETIYVSNQERGGVSVVTLEARRLRLRATVPGPGLGRERPVPSEIALHPDNASLVLANRVDDSLTVYAIAADGSLAERATVDSCGMNPRHFAFTPDGAALLVAHQDSDELVAFGWEGGLPVDPIRIPISTPTAVLFLR